MKKIALILLAIGLAIPSLADARRTDSRTVDARGLSRVDIDLPVGDLTIRGTTTDQVQIEMRVHCGWRGRCERADRIELEMTRVGDTLTIKLENFPESVRSLSVDLDLIVPLSFGLTLEQGVGDAKIEYLEGDLEIDLGVGDVTVNSPARAFRSVTAESGVGDADLRVGRSRVGDREGFLFLANSVDWRDGSGSSRIDIEVGVGDADVNLK